ncbi:hypothetical protein H5J25_13725 [Sphingomonas aliaeris]|uniref:Uncharacterized protein n=1 Tax=Sphingomonas aliaeris TaxID=2759526 RepID=A0A974NT51_9SPHN|nr:hypothetical protein [Sphingomonas aliaeris]QQV76504.1 hypothetical protein H5J25_13725 [Sphingomonas aliaeris]
MVTEATAADFLWLGDLRAHRARLMRSPQGMLLDEPQCARRCPQCCLGCAMANAMITKLEQSLGEDGGTVH